MRISSFFCLAFLSLAAGCSTSNNSTNAGPGGGGGSESTAGSGGSGQEPAGAAGKGGSSQAGAGQAGAGQAGEGQAGEGQAGAGQAGEGAGPGGSSGQAGSGGSAGASGSSGGASGQGGGAGAAGASGGDGYQQSQGAAYILAQATLARQGKPADFDNDGKPDYTTTVDDSGAVTVNSDQDEDGMPEFVYQWDPSSSSGTMATDPDQNGVNDLEIAITSDPYQRVILLDDDLDGTFERRVTETYAADGLTMHVLTETLDTDGNFAKESEVDISTAKNDGGCTQGGDNDQFPLNAPEDPIPGTGGNVVIRKNPGGATDGSKGECSDAHANKIKKAFDAAIQDGLSCLENTNSAAANLLKNALANGKLDISCGNTCNPATTYGSQRCVPVGGQTTCQRVRMTFSSKDLDAVPDNANASKVLHELLHWAGMPDNEDRHDEGLDGVYACARYCGGCVSGAFYTPPNMGITKNTDCSQCSDTQERRAQCGLKKQQKASDVNYAICHAGLGCIADNCEQPVEESVKDCSGRTVSLPTWCCKKCPSGCDSSNDLPCQLDANPDDNKCGGSTPHCG